MLSVTKPISTRTPHAGSDENFALRMEIARLFQPALPMRGVTRTMRDARITFPISTRTPHAGSDRAPLVLPDVQPDFNPHSPCGE